jgi:hypothetical protein
LKKKKKRVKIEEILGAVEDWQSGAGLSRAEQSGAELDSVDQGWVELSRTG